MSGLEIAVYCLAGLGAVMWLLHRPVKNFYWPWKPCCRCKRVWRRDEYGELEFMIPLCWNHFRNCNELCPSCEAAMTKMEEIERHTIV